ncbi:MAG: TolC family protein [Flavobacteriaceae bacterium]|jgi:outer membrane protein|nr:TolC family protein [Flavobacteriaceae bacterium]
MNKKLSLLVGFLFSVTGFAQEHWTLQDCVKKGEANSLKLKVAALETQVKEKSKQSIASYYLPEVTLNGTQSYNFGSAIDPNTNSRVSSNIQSTQASIDAGMSLFDYTSFINHKRQSLMIDYASLNEKEVLFEYQLSILMLFYDILESQSMLELQNIQLVNSKENLERVQKEVDAGAKSKSDWYDINYIYHNELINIEQTKNSLYNQKLQLLHLLYVETVEPQDYDVVQLEESIGQENSYVFNASVEKLRTNQLILEQDKQLLYAKNLPRVSLNYQYGSFYSKPFDSDIEMRVNSFAKQIGDNKSHYASLKVSIPVFQGGNIRREVRVKKEEIRLNTLRIKESEVKLRNQIIVISKEIDQLKAIALQLQNSIELSEKTFATTQAKYENGKVDIFSFNAAKNQLLNSQFALKKNTHNQAYLTSKIKLYNSNTL